MTEPDISTQTLFCESARNEQGGQVTLVGILPDHVNLSADTNPKKDEESKPALGSLCLYSRTRIPLDRPVKSGITYRFRAPSGTVIFENVLEQEFIEEHGEQARSAGNDFVLLLSQVESRPFPILEEGRFVMTAEYAGNEHFSGAVSFKIK